MSELHGRSIIAGEAVGGGGNSFRAFNPSEGQEFGPEFYEATPVEIDHALVAAARHASPPTDTESTCPVHVMSPLPEWR